MGKKLSVTFGVVIILVLLWFLSFFFIKQTSEEDPQKEQIQQLSDVLEKLQNSDNYREEIKVMTSYSLYSEQNIVINYESKKTNRIQGELDYLIQVGEDNNRIKNEFVMLTDDRFYKASADPKEMLKLLGLENYSGDWLRIPSQEIEDLSIVEFENLIDQSEEKGFGMLIQDIDEVKIIKFDEGEVVLSAPLNSINTEGYSDIVFVDDFEIFIKYDSASLVITEATVAGAFGYIEFKFSQFDSVKIVSPI